MKRRRWTGPEIQMLSIRYGDEGPAQLAVELRRSEDSVSSFAWRCGLRTVRMSYRKPEPGSLSRSRTRRITDS
jgi:hypothetical protein